MKKIVSWKFLGLGLLWLPVLSSLALFVFTADRGLQMTDEASYLLIAADPWRMGGHGTFYGFVLHPLWGIAGGHVAGFRVAGFLILALATLGLCLTAVRRVASENPPPFLVQGAVPLFLAGAFAFFSDGVRTPHYNWVVLVGAMIWCVGLLGVTKVEMSGAKFWLGMATGGIGCSLMVLGKWPGALAVLGVSLLAIGMTRKENQSGLIRYWLFSLLIGAALTGLVLGLYAGPQGVQSCLGRGWVIARELGSHHASLLLKYLLDLLNFIYRILRAYAWLVGPLWVLAWVLPKFGIQGERRFRILVLLGFLFGMGLAFLRGHGIGGALNWNKESLMAGIWLTGVGALTWSGIRRFSRAEIALSTILLVLPFALAFGTNTSMADYAGHAVVFWSLLGWLLLVKTGVGDRIGSFGLWSILACLVSIQTMRQMSSLEAQWKIGSVWKQTESVSAGPEQGRLKVNWQFNSDLEATRKILTQAGFRQGDHLIVISDMPGLVYLLGARSVGVPWYESWGWEARLRFAKAVLVLQGSAELEKSWVILAQPTDEPSLEIEQVWPRSAKLPVSFGTPEGISWSREWSDEGKAPLRLRLFQPSADRFRDI